MIKRNKTIQTVVVNDNNNPIFYQTIESYLYWVDIDYAPPVVLEIYDLDKGVVSNSWDYIGRSIINLSEASIVQNEDVPRPKWHSVKFGNQNDEPEMGQILVSFSILDPK